MHTVENKVTKFANGNHTPKEASRIVERLINEQINFQKLNYLSEWEKNHQLPLDTLDQGVNDLLNKKQHLLNTIQKAEQSGKKINLGGSIELDIWD
jgi:serine phosphatase RsbU (regulator of sigma subunit)